jgi:hypothetical protein
MMKFGEALAYLDGKATKSQLRRWLENGWVDEAVKGVGGHWRIPKEGLDRCVEQFTPSRRKKNVRNVRHVRNIESGTFDLDV